MANRQGDKSVNLSSRIDILAQIRNPLVFFGLALLVIEGIFAITVLKSTMTGDQQYRALWIMGFLFLTVIGVVALITIKWPEHFYEDYAKWKQTTQRIERFITTTAFRDAIGDILQRRVKSECLIGTYNAEQNKQNEEETEKEAEQ